MSISARGTDDEKPPSMPEETGKSKVASWLTSQGLKKVIKDNVMLEIYRIHRNKAVILLSSSYSKRLNGKRWLFFFMNMLRDY